MKLSPYFAIGMRKFNLRRKIAKRAEKPAQDYILHLDMHFEKRGARCRLS
jgi:hypothetical protein